MHPGWGVHPKCQCRYLGAPPTIGIQTSLGWSAYCVLCERLGPQLAKIISSTNQRHENCRFSKVVFNDVHIIFSHHFLLKMFNDLYGDLRWSSSSWWFQPIWKICSSNWIISPSRGENKKYLSCHHLVMEIWWNLEIGHLPSLIDLRLPGHCWLLFHSAQPVAVATFQPWARHHGHAGNI